MNPLTQREKSQQFRNKLKAANIRTIAVMVHDDDRERLRKYAKKLLKTRLKDAGLELHAGPGSKNAPK